MRIPRSVRLLTGTVVTLALASCEPAPVDSEPVERKGAALNGTLTFGHGCSNDMALLIQDAMDIDIAPILLSHDSRLVDCLKDVHLTGGVTFQQEVSYPEWILRRLKENMITTVECADLDDNDNAQAELGINHEFMTIDRRFMTESVELFGWEGARLRVAGVMVHEIAHNKGYQHPVQKEALVASDNFSSVPVEVASCLTDLSPDSVLGEHNKQRSRLPRESTLAPVGLEGGQPLFAGSTHCSDHDFVTGLRGRSSGSINALGLRCTPPEGGPHNFKATFGGSGGTSFDLGCFDGELAVGLHGTAESFINSVGMVCQARSDVLQGSTSGRFFDPTVGGNSGLQWSRTCPPHQALKAVRMRTATLVDRIELVCYDPGITPISHDLQFMTSVGGGGNSNSRLYFEHCSGRSIMMGVEANAGWGIDRLAAGCETVFRRSSTLVIEGLGTPITGHGGSGGLWARRLKCNFDIPDRSNTAMIGLRLSTNGQVVTSVANICTDDVRTWARGTNVPVRRIVGEAGVVNGTPRDVVCPVGKFPVGWKLKAGNSHPSGLTLVENVQLACRSL
jgi:hypothetical protein